jgi:uncharacterized PurR-regulated membrane protein YhhQ (DUF165 family)
MSALRNLDPREERYEQGYVYLGAVFIASLVVCNLIVQKFFVWEPFGLKNFFYLSAGIIPYPITFLVTDILSECYGKKRANQVVLAGLAASIFVVFVVVLSDGIRAGDAGIFHSTLRTLSGADAMTGKELPAEKLDLYFHQIFGRTSRAVAASMIAYLVAQLVDIQLFHFWRRLTNGKHLWIRNNFSTITSQLVDTTLVVSLLFLGTDIQGRIPQMILSGWVFKILMALSDTPFFYLAVLHWRKRFPVQVAAHDDLALERAGRS